MHLFHIPPCTIQNRNVHISVLNGALWDMEQVNCGIWELGQYWQFIGVYPCVHLSDTTDFNYLGSVFRDEKKKCIYRYKYKYEYELCLYTYILYAYLYPKINSARHGLKSNQSYKHPMNHIPSIVPNNNVYAWILMRNTNIHIAKSIKPFKTNPFEFPGFIWSLLLNRVKDESYNRMIQFNDAYMHPQT